MQTFETSDEASTLRLLADAVAKCEAALRKNENPPDGERIEEESDSLRPIIDGFYNESGQDAIEKMKTLTSKASKKMGTFSVRMYLGTTTSVVDNIPRLPVKMRYSFH